MAANPWRLAHLLLVGSFAAAANHAPPFSAVEMESEKSTSFDHLTYIMPSSNEN